MGQAASIPTFHLLCDRQQYRTGHIRLPDLDQPISAIQVNQGYYSYLKFVADPTVLLNWIQHLSDRDITVAVTANRRGHTIWGLEPEAQPTRPASLTTPHAAAPPQCHIVAFEHYQAPDHHPVMSSTPSSASPTYLSSQPTLYLQPGEYVMLRLEPDAAKALSLVARLLQQHIATAIALTPAGYAILRQHQQQPCVPLSA